MSGIYMSINICIYSYLGVTVMIFVSVGRHLCCNTSPLSVADLV